MQFFTKITTPLAVAALAAALIAATAEAQNVSSSGQNWSSGWGFASPSDRNLALQQAQAIRQARTQPGPNTVGHLDFSPFFAVQWQSGGLKPAGSGFLGYVAA